jgi:type III secretion system FlhB-like substrate exporter
LARALGPLELGEAIPERLYDPAAEVLRFAHRASGGVRGAA